MSMQRGFLRVFSLVVILSMFFSGFAMPSASAQGRDGILRQVNSQTGKVSFIGPENGPAISAAKALGTLARPQDPAMALATRFGPEFGLMNPERDLKVMKTNHSDRGRMTVRYQQHYQGVPVLGGELIVNTNERGDLYSINGEVTPRISISTQPTITADEARQAALESAEKWYQQPSETFITTEPELWIYDENLLRLSTRPVELVWRMEVTAVDERLPVRELVLVNAHRGSISLHFNQIDTAWSLRASSADSQDSASTATPVPVPTEAPLDTATPEPVATEPPATEVTNSKENAFGASGRDVGILAAVTWYVATTGNDANSCSSTSNPCATINGAMEKAADGDFIHVASGVYQGNAAIVDVLKSVTILGGWNSDFSAQTGYSILDGTGNPAHIILIRTSTSAVLERLIIRNAGGAINAGTPGTCSTATSVTLRQSSIIGMSYWDAVLNCVTFSLINSTIYNNRQGAISNSSGNVFIQSSTITNNIDPYDAGGIRNSGGSVSIQNSILTTNSNDVGPQDCSGTITSNGHNIIGTTSGCTIALQPSDKVGVNPSFGPLHPNGYFPLLSNSPAINSGASCPAVDQRGVARPQGSACDIGAFEYATPGNAAKLLILDGDNQRTVPGAAFPKPLKVVVLDNQDNLVPNVSVTFTAPSSGVSGVFSNTGARTTTAVSGIDGIAISSQFQANGQSGAYVVTASAGGAASANFSLQNSAWYVAPTGNDSNSCLSPNSPCATINGAIDKASAGDAIAVAIGTYTDTDSERVALINKDLTLLGGWNNTFTAQNGTSIIDGQKARGGIEVSLDVVALVDRFIVQNGKTQYGSGVLNNGTLTLNNMMIRYNYAGLIGSGGGGAGIGNGGTLTINNSTIYGNVLTVGHNGGGISNGGTLHLNNSTVSENIGGEAAVYNSGVLIANNSTITRNRGYGFYYGIYSTGIDWGGTVTLTNTLVAGNGFDGDCTGPIKSQGYNLIGNKPTECTFTSSTGDKVGTPASPINPRLSVLQDNGGLAFTHALLTGSPAINAGSPATPGSGGNACLAVDQRGTARPVGTRCDIGAYEGSTNWAPAYRVRTYTANHTSSLPGTLLCDQTDPGCAVADVRASMAHHHAIGTYNLYSTQFGRNSLDNKGMPIISTINYQLELDYSRAFWNGSQVVYGDDVHLFLMADDVVAHELTHGVTQFESNLFHYYQSGSISESLSDLWGEYYDQTNGFGNDLPSVRWLIGEDVFIPNFVQDFYRDMSNPTVDRMSRFYKPTFGDEIEANSGVNNKAVFLMVDGGTFNGKTVTALGWEKTVAIYYEANTNLLFSGADYSDLYYALRQACTNLIGKKGITASDCNEVKDALDAVEMNLQLGSFNSDAPLCNANAPVFAFFDDLEAGPANWTFSNGAYPRWQFDSPYGQYAQSGQHFLYADDYPGQVTDASARLKSFVVPSNAYLHFAHAYDFERDHVYYYDGGVLEYSVNNGVTWLDAGHLMEYNGYTGTIVDGQQNPLKGRSAFVGSSHGYVSTRLNLASLAGQTVTFRWRMGLDYTGIAWGWWLDSVKVYTCGVPGIFSDVGRSYWAWQYIERLYNAGVTGGCNSNPLMYCPEATVTRDQMAVFLLKAGHGKFYTPPAVAGSTGFADVPLNHWAAAWIKQLAAEGITGGCGAGTFCPGQPVTRDQMAVFLLKAKHGKSYTPPPLGGSTGFTDVPPNHWAAAWIKQLAAEGITGGCGAGTFCPGQPVNRAEMAVFLVRTFNLP